MSRPLPGTGRVSSALRLYVIADLHPRVGPLETFLDQAIAGGMGLFQLRDKEAADAELVAAGRRCVEICRRAGVPCIVNDRLDIALACGADGVHLGQDDVSPADARRIAGDDFLIGLSTHSVEQIAAAAHVPVDYIGVGPVYPTPTKEGRPAVGLELVRYAARHARQPFFAIGGLDPSNAGEVVAAGAHGIAVLRWVAQAEHPREAAAAILRAMARAGPATPANAGASR
jgi:thiamine-phosphate pyrophosphorylase